jgi:hypothetical protein
MSDRMTNSERRETNRLPGTICPIMSKPAAAGSNIIGAHGQPPGGKLDGVPCVGERCALWCNMTDAQGNTFFAGCAHVAQSVLLGQLAGALNGIAGGVHLPEAVKVEKYTEAMAAHRLQTNQPEKKPV